MSLKRNSSDNDFDPMSFESILQDHFVKLTMLTLRFNAFESSHDPKLIDSALSQRAVGAIDEQMNKTLEKLRTIRGEQQSNK